MVGNQKGPMVWKGSTMPAGEAVAPAAIEGQTALKSGHKSAFSRLPSEGKECVRAHHKAVKKAPKNITSEKMNHVMLQRKDKSILRLYMPPSLSLMASLNHWYNTTNHQIRPANREYLPHSSPLIHWPAPKITKNKPNAAMAGWRDAWGT